MTESPPRPLRVHHVAKELGVPKRTIYRWLIDGRFPGAFRVGGTQWRIPRSDLEEIVIRVPTRDDGADGADGAGGEVSRLDE